MNEGYSMSSMRMMLLIMMVDVVASVVVALARWCPSADSHFGSLLEMRFSASISWYVISLLITSEIRFHGVEVVHRGEVAPCGTTVGTSNRPCTMRRLHS